MLGRMGSAEKALRLIVEGLRDVVQVGGRLAFWFVQGRSGVQVVGAQMWVPVLCVCACVLGCPTCACLPAWPLPLSQPMLNCCYVFCRCLPAGG